MEYKKAYGSTLAPVSKKRLAEGKPFGLKRTPLRAVAKKTAANWAAARRLCFKKFGKVCLLCDDTEGPFHIHHWDETRQQNPGRVLDQSNLCVLCWRHHSHRGADARFYKLRELIKEKLQRIEDEKREDA